MKIFHRIKTAQVRIHCVFHKTQTVLFKIYVESNTLPDTVTHSRARKTERETEKKQFKIFSLLLHALCHVTASEKMFS